MITKVACGVAGLVLAVLPLHLHAQKKDPPKLLVADPFFIDAGTKPVRIKLRGLKLDSVAEVRIHEPKSSAKLIGKPAKVSVDQKFLKSIGDTQIEVELIVPPETGAREVAVTVVSPGGESTPFRLLVNGSTPRVADKEPNNGFRQAQSVSLPVVIDGAIQQVQDVDVFRFEGKSGQRLSVLLHARRYGSPLDPILTLYDERGRTIRASDACASDEPAKLSATLPTDGAYFLAVIDAQDQGGPLFGYRLQIELKK